MNKFTLLIAILNFVVPIFGQIQIFHKDSPSEILNDTEFDIEGRETDIQVKDYLMIKNISDEEYSLKVVRERLVFGSSDDLLCYAGECYSTTDPDDPDTYVFPVMLNLAPDEESEFEPGFFPGFQKFCAKHAYKIYDDEDVLLTTLTINFNIGMESCELSTKSNLIVDNKKAVLYPNPSAGSVTIKNFSKGSSLKIIDVLGKTWKTEQLSGQIYKLDVNNLPDGVYFYSITNKNGVVSPTHKLVVKK